ncbi:unannotated protein [freshwater metagenome]|uniref:Unannotated protein n=1 Tax=freshwater metagenome TaxID=449393 RepID=A0A6J5YL76_9ZZZZ
MHTDDIKTVVVAEPELEADGEHAEHAGSEADDDRGHPTHESGAGGDGHKPGHCSRGCAQSGGLAFLDLLDEQPAEHAGRCSEERIHERLSRNPVSPEGGASVEPEPSEPQDAGSEQSERQGVGVHTLTRPAATLAENQHHSECGSTRVDVDDCATSEVEGTELGQPSTSEHPVSHRGIDDDEPQSDEHGVGLELEPIGRSAGDERRRDDSKGHLIGAEQHERNGEGERLWPCVAGDVAHPGEVQIADDATVAEVPERKREDDGHPQNRHEAHGEEVLHEHAQHVLGPHHAAVEEGESGRHEQH